MPPLAVEALGPEAGPRLVLVHGFTQTGRSWLPLAEPLAVEGWRVVLVDAPGHGGSGELKAGMWEAADLLAAVGGRAVYVGYSMGGRMVLHLALAHPALARALVLVGATAGIEHPTERAARRRSDEALARDLERDGLERFLERWLASPLFSGLAPDRAGLDERRRNTVAGLASSLRLAGTGAQEPLWGRVSDLGQSALPVLVMAGAADRRFVAVGRRLADRIGPSATFATVPGAGHAAHLEQPAEALALLRSFLADLPHDVRRRRPGRPRAADR